MQNFRLFGHSQDSTKHTRQLSLSEQSWERLGELAEAKKLDRAAYIESYVNDLQQEKQELKHIVDGLQALAQGDQDLIANLTNEIEELQQSLTALDQEAQQLDDENFELQERINQFDIEKASLKQRIQQLDEDKTALQQKVQKIGCETLQLRQQVQQFDSEQTSLKQPEEGQTTLQQEIRQLDEDKTALQQEVQQLDEGKTTLQQEVQQLDFKKVKPYDLKKPISHQQVGSAKVPLLRQAIGFVLSLVIILLIGGFTLPSTVHVERSIHIDAPPSDIFPLVGNFAEWSQWSPWAEMEPDMEMTIHGSSDEQVLNWQSDDPKIGTGTQEITVMDPPRSVNYHLNFGDQGVAEAAFSLEADEEGTVVTWLFDSDMRTGVPIQKQPLSTYFSYFMDDIVGQQFDSGLINLKDLAEQNHPTISINQLKLPRIIQKFVAE